MLGFLKKFFRDKGKDALRVSADQEEIKKLEEKLDRAMKDFTVRIIILRNQCFALILFTRSTR
jgi:hypothetical protein